MPLNMLSPNATNAPSQTSGTKQTPNGTIHSTSTPAISVRDALSNA